MRMSCAVIGLVVVAGCFTAVSWASELPVMSPLDQAEAYLELINEGFPGPGIDAVTTRDVLYPLSLLTRTTKAAHQEKEQLVRLRACVLLGRWRLLRIVQSGAGLALPPDEEKAVNEAWVGCRSLPKISNPESSLYCWSMNLVSLTVDWSKKTAHRVELKCSEFAVALARLEAITRRISLTAKVEEEDLSVPLDGTISWFERAYGQALAQGLAQRLKLAAQVAHCKESKECESCRKVVQGLFGIGEDELATAILNQMTRPDMSTVCRQQVLLLYSWSQDWESFDALLAGVPEPRPEWSLAPEIYRLLHRADVTVENARMQVLLGSLANRADGPQLVYGIQALLVAKEVFGKTRSASEGIDWLTKKALALAEKDGRHEVLAVALTFLSAMADGETLISFMDSFLRVDGVSGDCAVLSRIALEVLAVALHNRDVSRLQQAMVLLKQVREQCLDNVIQLGRIDVYLLLVRWADRQMAGEPEQALTILKNQSRDVLVRLSARIDRGIRTMLVSNYLTAAACCKSKPGHNLTGFLHEVEYLNGAGHAHWIQKYLGQKRYARAHVIVERCLAETVSAREHAGCLFWKAALARTLGNDQQARQSRLEAEELLGQGLDKPMPALFFADGERRASVFVDWNGELRISTGFLPLYFLIPMPPED
jgi:hypothetical protein